MQLFNASHSCVLTRSVGASLLAKSLRPQAGSALIVVLVIMILLMLLGVTAMTTSDMQYKLTGNLQYENLAMDNAEQAAAMAERTLEAAAASLPTASLITRTQDPLTLVWDDTNSTRIDLDGDGNLDEQGRYTFTYVSTNSVPTAGLGLVCSDPGNEHNFDCVNTYKVTARGQSGRGAIKFVQTYFAVPLK